MGSKTRTAFFRLISMLLLGPGAGTAAELNFIVQPVIDRDATAKAFQPLATYLSSTTGESVRLQTAYDYADCWFRMKGGSHYDLILDAPFYVDYRIKKQNHVPLVKVPGLVSYSLVALSSAGLLETAELVGKKIATLIPPAPGGLVMAKMFPHPSRQPYLVPVKSAEDALAALFKGQVAAALVPTPLAAQAMVAGREIAVIATSEQTPHMTLTAGPSVPKEVRDRIKQALLTANQTAAGRAMLQQIGFEGFETTSAAVYDGYSKYLEQEWNK